MINSSFIALLLLFAIGFFFILVLFVFPNRKLPVEKNLEILYQEKCSVKWKYFLGFSAAGNLPVARLTFYQDFFVVAMLKVTKINYSDIISVSNNSSFFSKSLTIVLGSSQLIIYPNGINKILSILTSRQ